MLNGIMLLWFSLTAMAVAFVAIDIRSTPELPVLKWGFVLLTGYTGPFGAFLYVLGCREPLPGLHERYTAARWRQVLGSTMHCVAGDGIGILVGAVVASHFIFVRPLDIALEYSLGFGFGWTIFQAMFMRAMAGGSYRLSLSSTFLPEFLSMNTLMAAMLPVAALGKAAIGAANNPLTPEFWFVMSMALCAGFLAAYPMNWWLVARGLKHGMTTVRPATSERGAMDVKSQLRPMAMPADGGRVANVRVSRSEIIWMVALSIVLFSIGASLSMVIAH